MNDINLEIEIQKAYKQLNPIKKTIFWVTYSIALMTGIIKLALNTLRRKPWQNGHHELVII